MHIRDLRNTAVHRVLSASVVSLLMVSACAAADAPSQAAVEKVLKSSWDKSAIPKSVLTLNAVKFGPAYKATAQEVQVEGIPKGMVTPAIVDFTVRTYYNSETQVLRRVREARVYKDKMGDWAVMTGSPKGEDVRTKEPAAK
jgi:hypothetical protein